jgi:hypothetical protein
MRKTEASNKSFAVNPEPPPWKLVPLELPPTILTRPPRVFLSAEDRRIWRYTSPRFRGIPRPCSPPISPAKRRRDDASTQTERPARVHRGVQAETDSEWEPEEETAGPVLKEDKACQVDLRVPAEAPPPELPAVSSTQHVIAAAARDGVHRRDQPPARRQRIPGREEKARRTEALPPHHRTTVRRRHSPTRRRAATPARRRERTPNRRPRHQSSSEGKRTHRR